MRSVEKGRTLPSVSPLPPVPSLLALIAMSVAEEAIAATSAAEDRELALKYPSSQVVHIGKRLQYAIRMARLAASKQQPDRNADIIQPLHSCRALCFSLGSLLQQLRTTLRRGGGDGGDRGNIVEEDIKVVPGWNLMRCSCSGATRADGGTSIPSVFPSLDR